MNFWETDEWIKAKTHRTIITDKLLSRVDYLLLVGSKNYSDESYKKYLQAMERKENDNSQIEKTDV